MHRPARFVTSVRVLTTHDVNIEELSRVEAGPPEEPSLG
jgi:hypothetical protein